MNIQKPTCPHCKNDDMSLIEIVLRITNGTYYLCNVCSKSFFLKD